MKALRHPVLLGALASLAVALIVAGQRLDTWQMPGLERLELYTLDLRFKLRGPRPAADEVAILVFDDASYETDPDLWEQRAGWARVVRAAAAAKAKVIVLDALFTQPEQMLPEELRRELEAYVAAHPEPLPEVPADLLVRRILLELGGDAKLAAAIQEAGNVVLMLHLGSARDGITQTPDPYLARGRYGQSVPGERHPPAARTLIASMPELNRYARALGFASVVEDETNSVRRVDSARLYEEGVFAPLGVSAVAAFLDVPRARLAWLGSVGELRIGELTHRLESDGRMLLNFRGPSGAFDTHSVADLVRGELPEGALEGRIVVVGPTHLGHDRVRTSFSQVSFGVEIHATLIDNILHGDPLRRTPWWLDGLICLLAGLIVSLFFWPRLMRSALLQVAGAMATVAAWFAVSGWLFVSRDLWAPWFGPGLACLLAGGLCLSAAYLGEGLQRRRLRKAFAHYLSDEVIAELLRNPEMLALGGKRRELSVLFSDIRNFTSFSESLSPEQLIGLLNTYLTPMTRAVLGSGGFLDKYIGDAVMAVFGAPVPRQGHADDAVACALRMHGELAALRPVLAAQGVDDLRIGVGINTGQMVVGNMGAAERFDYTVAGDSVNLASRLEGLTKFYGVFCLVGNATREAAVSRFDFREIDLVQVKGRSEPVSIHELLGERGGERVAEYTDVQEFERGLRLWRAGELAEARGAFLTFLESNPNDSVAAIYLERLDVLGDEAPEAWSGVYVATAK